MLRQCGALTMAMHVMFVDDESQLLEGLKRMLRSQREDWVMTFVASGEAALAHLASHPCDVIVSDMRMPGMDGAALLREVKERYPHVVRLVLSGHADVASSLAVVGTAHQFLAKPCDGAILKETIQRTCNLRSHLADPRFQTLVGETSTLPGLPTVYVALRTALENPDTRIADLAAIVEGDVALCAKTLQIVNSAFFGLPRRISRMEEAIGHIGTSLLKALVLSGALFHWSEETGSLAGIELKNLQAHSLLTARIAMQLLSDQSASEDAFMAGMLHDVGRLILATSDPAGHLDSVAASRDQQRAVSAIEADRYGFDHGQIGAYLLGLWGLPSAIVEAVAFHHEPARAGSGRFDVLGAVHVADCLAHSRTPDRAPHAEWDLRYLDAMGVLDRLPAWGALASRLAATAE